MSKTAVHSGTVEIGFLFGVFFWGRNDVKLCSNCTVEDDDEVKTEVVVLWTGPDKRERERRRGNRWIDGGSESRIGWDNGHLEEVRL